MKSFNSLPDLCLVKILSRMPLCDLIRNRRVCTKWKWLQSILTAQIGSLTILVGKDAFQLIERSPFKRISDKSVHILNDDGTPMYAQEKLCPFSSLVFKIELEIDSVHLLVGMFPNVLSLKMALNQTESTQSMLMVAVLFRFMCQHLITLELFCDFNECFMQDPKQKVMPRFVSRQLFNSINSMSLLKKLTLDFQNPTNCAFLHHHHHPSEETFVDLSIISQLDELNYYSSEMIIGTLKRYAQAGSRPLRIQYGLCELNSELFKLDQFQPQLCRRFTRFVSQLGHVRSEQLNNFCTRFTSITYACLDVSDITLRHLFNNLAKLTQLIHLSVNIDFPTIEPDDEEEEAHQQLLAQSPSVKAVHLGLYLSNHDNLALLNLPWTCPNVQVASVKVYDYEKVCDICNYNETEGEQIVPEVNILQNCYKRVLLPLQHCPPLLTVTSFEVRPLKEFEVEVATKMPLTKADLMQPIEFKQSSV